MQRLTPMDFSALYARWQRDQRRQDWRAALVAWTVASVHPTKGRKPKLTDFLPEDMGPTRSALTAQEQYQKILVVHRRLGGKGE